MLKFAIYAQFYISITLLLEETEIFKAIICRNYDAATNIFHGTSTLV